MSFSSFLNVRLFFTKVFWPPHPKFRFVHLVSVCSIAMEAHWDPQWTAGCHPLSRAGEEVFWRIHLSHERREAVGHIGSDKWNIAKTKPTLEACSQLSKPQGLQMPRSRSLFSSPGGCFFWTELGSTRLLCSEAYLLTLDCGKRKYSIYLQHARQGEWSTHPQKTWTPQRFAGKDFFFLF